MSGKEKSSCECRSDSMTPLSPTASKTATDSGISSLSARADLLCFKALRASQKVIQFTTSKAKKIYFKQGNIEDQIDLVLLRSNLKEKIM